MMKRICRYILKCLIVFFVGFVLIGSVVNYVPICVEAEYTEEQKQQAKAWLSAHGYAPTQAGASQAYQDYLNGKFDGDPQVEAILGKRQTEATTVVTTENPDQWEDVDVDGEDTTAAVNSSVQDAASTTDATTTETVTTTAQTTTMEFTTTQSKVDQIEKKIEKEQKKTHKTKVGFIVLGVGVLVLVVVLFIVGKDWM